MKQLTHSELAQIRSLLNGTDPKELCKILNKIYGDRFIIVNHTEPLVDQKPVFLEEGD